MKQQSRDEKETRREDQKIRAILVKLRGCEYAMLALSAEKAKGRDTMASFLSIFREFIQ